jgi:hypothetical protein
MSGVRAVSGIAAALCVVLAAVGVMGVVSPDALLAFAGAFQTTPMLYAAGAFRVLFGVALALAAPASRIPTLLRPLGILIVVAGLATPLFGVERMRAIVAWISGVDPGFVRVAACFPLALGSFLAWAVWPRRTSG